MPARLLSTVAALGLAISPAQAQSPDGLITSLDRENLRAIIEATDFDLGREIADGFEVTVSGRPTITAALSGCDGAGACSHLLLRSTWAIGASAAARAAVEDFDRNVPIAFVMLAEEGDVSAVIVGRDLWLTPGRTPTNIVQEMLFAAELAVSMRMSLSESDPSLSWSEP